MWRALACAGFQARWWGTARVRIGGTKVPRRLKPATLVFFVCAAAFAAGRPDPSLEWKIVDDARVPVPPHEHPRLYLRARDLPDLKRRVEHPVLKPVWEKMQREMSVRESLASVHRLRDEINQKKGPPKPEVARASRSTHETPRP